MSIDLSKVPKNKIKDGRYLNCVTFVSLDELGRFGRIN